MCAAGTTNIVIHRQMGSHALFALLPITLIYTSNKLSTYYHAIAYELGAAQYRSLYERIISSLAWTAKDTSPCQCIRSRSCTSRLSARDGLHFRYVPHFSKFSLGTILVARRDWRRGEWEMQQVLWHRPFFLSRFSGFRDQVDLPCFQQQLCWPFFRLLLEWLGCYCESCLSGSTFVDFESICLAPFWTLWTPS